MKIFNPTINNNDVNTIDTAKEALYSKGRYAYWSPFVATSPAGMGATFTAPTYTNRGEDIQLTNTASDGQNARINWFSNSIDWTKDFKVELSYYCSLYTNLGDTGDGFAIYMGSSNATVDTYANSASDGALKFRLFTYNGNTSPNQGGAAFYIGSSKGPQGKTGNDWSTQKWMRIIIEVCTDKITSKRLATAYYSDDTTVTFANKYYIAAMEVTNWVPAGGNFGFYCSTGGARANQYMNSIEFSSL
jgi:hypothetical protein